MAKKKNEELNEALAKAKGEEVVEKDVTEEPRTVEKEVKTLKTLKKNQKLNEKEEAAKKIVEDLNSQKQKKGNEFSTRPFRDYSRTTIMPGKILYPTLAEKIKAEKAIKPEVQASENLKRALSPKIATIFTGKITGTSSVENPDGEKKYFFIVNSDCGVKGYKGRVIRILLEDYIVPIATPKGEMPEQFSTEEKSESAIYAFMNSRIGSEVDFTIKYMEENDYETGIVLGNRIPAAKRRTTKYWRGKTRKDSDNMVDLLSEDSIIKARVVASLPQGIYCEAFGLETFIEKKELSYNFVRSARELFKPGDTIEIRINNLSKTEKSITFKASHKDTYEDPAPAYMASYMAGDNIRGTVTRVIFNEKNKELFYIINVDNKFEMGAISKGGLQMTANPGDQVEVEIRNVDVDLKLNQGKVTGLVKHIIRNPDFSD